MHPQAFEPGRPRATSRNNINVMPGISRRKGDDQIGAREPIRAPFGPLDQPEMAAARPFPHSQVVELRRIAQPIQVQVERCQ
jgi:hypothetical protein